MTKFEVTWLEDRSDEGVLEEIRRVAAIYPGHRLTKDMFDSHARIKSDAVARRFGSWSEATRRAALTMALPEYSRTAVIEDLKRVSASSQDVPFTEASYSKHGGQYSRSMVRRMFGGWREALDTAGIGNRYAGPLVSARMHSQPGRAMSDEAILAQIRHVSAKLGRQALAGADIARNSEITQDLIHRRFGSVSAALKRAGIEHAKLGRRYTEDEMFENLLRVWTHHGRTPAIREMDQSPSTVGPNAYLKRYGGWRKALKAFVERANSETDINTRPQPEAEPSMPVRRTAPMVSPNFGTIRPREPRHTAQNESRTPVAVPSRTNAVAEGDRRNLSIGLRFRVLQRDHFKCVLCGDHPARNADCILHVDHIVPWSKGGKTREDNLRTLCAACNVGRGNRFAD